MAQTEGVGTKKAYQVTKQYSHLRSLSPNIASDTTVWSVYLRKFFRPYYMWVVLVPFGTVGSKSDQIRDVTITAGLQL